MITLTVHYFASLKEQAGIDKESITTNACTPAELYERLQQIHSFHLPIDQVRFAMNNAYVESSVELVDGQELLLLPPVAGG